MENIKFDEFSLMIIDVNRKISPLVKNRQISNKLSRIAADSYYKAPEVFEHLVVSRYAAELEKNGHNDEILKLWSEYIEKHNKKWEQFKIQMENE